MIVFAPGVQGLQVSRRAALGVGHIGQQRSRGTDCQWQFGDVVARSLVLAATQALVDRTEIEVGHLGPGWRRALSGLAAVALQPPDGAVVEPA